MSNLPTINLWLKNKAPDSKGMLPIILRITFDRKLYYQSTGLKAAPKNFHKDLYKAIGSKDPNSDYKNAIIRKKVSQLEREFLSLEERGELSPSAIKQILSGDASSSGMKFSILNLKVRSEYEGILAESTLRQYKAESTKLEQYKPGILVHEITTTELLKYEQYMRKTLKNTSNTVLKTLTKLQSIFEKAIAMKLVKDNPVKDYNKPKYTNPKRDVLDIEEQNRIEKYADEGANNYYRLVAAWFCLQMYSGLRYSDLVGWDEKKMIRNNKLYFSDDKEKNVHYIPLYPKLERAIERVRDLRSIPVNQDCNAALKEIAKLCDISIRVSTHIARHTFAVTYLDNGGSLEVLQQLLGHTQAKTTAIYGKITSKRIDEETGRVFGK